MVKNTIQEERMRSYFIEATKELLKGEGLRSVNVRSVAQKAGYSFATIYNYFKDSKELVFECVKDFLDECEQFVLDEIIDKEPGRERIAAKTKAYVKYFVQYPGIFELFFIERPNDLAGRQSTLALINSFYYKLCKEDWNKLIEEGGIDKTNAEKKQAHLNFSVLGMLLLYINRKSPESYTDFFKSVDDMVNAVLD